MAEKLSTKFYGLLYLGENCQETAPIHLQLLSGFNYKNRKLSSYIDYSPEGVNYKLFKNSCQYNITENVYKKALSRKRKKRKFYTVLNQISEMNRNVTDLIHVDESILDIEEGYEKNCLFLSDFESFEEREKLIAIARALLDIIAANPEDVREAITPVTAIYRKQNTDPLTVSS